MPTFLSFLPYNPPVPKLDDAMYSPPAMRKWLESIGLPVPQELAAPEVSAIAWSRFTVRNPGKESLRSFRRRVKRERIMAFGGVRKFRAALAMRRAEETRWEVLLGQGLPLVGTDALIWAMWHHMVTEPRRTKGDIRSYVDYSFAQSVTGGFNTPEIDSIRADIQKASLEVSRRRNNKRRMADSSGNIRSRLKAQRIKAAKSAVSKSFTFTKKVKSEVDVSFSDSIASFRVIGDTTGITASLPKYWWSRVYLTGKWDLFGKETLVLYTKGDLYLVARTAGRKKNLKVIQWGYLSRDKRGYPIFTEV